MRVIQHMEATEMEEVQRLYIENNSGDPEIDESDLIIFRLMGAKFEYSAVIFKD